MPTACGFVDVLWLIKHAMLHSFRCWPLATLLLPALAQAHPHVWVTYDVAVQFRQGKIESLKERWVFDEDFTTAVLSDVAKDHKAGKPLTRAEAAKVKKGGFDNLQNYGYFQHVFIEKTPVNVKAPTDFVAKLEGNKMVYEFTLPLERPVDPHQGRVTLGFYDESFFVDYEPTRPTSVSLTGDGVGSCKLESFEDHAHPIFYGSVNPLVWKVIC
ncbi:DUF1007 family protein [Silvimonas iriomotensis]|uniref:DUF1007 family protein n=1 Tax=Silvimonas iriomotensis TaxID=449662 RepID=A0ABQ2PDD7_9NEIS|nr:DUF1007 family protein [Silvimonas iriomotensis]GGP23257.1 hypothetical protein GCM10010970_32570 [Silvimonas iriomotensis]